MKPITLIIILVVILESKLWSQDNLWNSKQNILLKYESYSDTTYKYTISDNANTMSVGIYGEDSLEVDHFFRPYTNGTLDNETTCDSIVIKLLCNDCAEYHISEMISDNDRKWVKLSDSLYISSKWVSKFMPADKSPNLYTVPIMKIVNDESPTQIILYTKEFTKEQWKELKNRTITIID